MSTAHTGAWMLVLALSSLACALPGETVQAQLPCDGFTRSYRLHLPTVMPATCSLVLVLHGGFGSAQQAERCYGFDASRESQQAVIVYADGLGEHGHEYWNDGRGVVHRTGVADDVRFLESLVASLMRRYPIDPHRVYCCGISNGAMMCERLAAQANSPFAAIACVAGTLPLTVTREFTATTPTSVMLIHGTLDRFVPIAGGDVKPAGKVLSLEATLDRWCVLDGIQGPARTTVLPHVHPEDATRVERDVYPPGGHGTEVACYRVIGGGHTWPGCPASTILGIAGAVTYDFDATAMIWRFFLEHPRAP